jgi:hypothetical protein
MFEYHVGTYFLLKFSLWLVVLEENVENPFLSFWALAFLWSWKMVENLGLKWLGVVDCWSGSVVGVFNQLKLSFWWLILVWCGRLRKNAEKTYLQ